MTSKHSFFDPDMPYLAIREAIPIKIIFIRKNINWETSPYKFRPMAVNVPNMPGHILLEEDECVHFLAFINTRHEKYGFMQ